jgi:hypothetical protein
MTKNWLVFALTLIFSILLRNNVFCSDRDIAVSEKYEVIKKVEVPLHAIEPQTYLSKFLQKAETLKETLSNEDEELQKARKTLVSFFNYLHDGQYEKAVPLFEPWKEGIGMHGSSWEGLASFSLPKDRKDKAQVLKRYCEASGTCLRVNILNAKKVADNEYILKVQFLNNDGSIFAYSCCGSTTSQKEFDYYVHEIKGVYKVRTPPLFRP